MGDPVPLDGFEAVAGSKDSMTTQVAPRRCMAIE